MPRVRSIPESFDAAAVGEIDDLLRAVAVEHGVAIPLAVESGSRAWGFPSPDSDYDCRFVYVRPARHYLTPWLPRDVIEHAPAGLLDVNGWDVRKAVALLVKGNAVILEWLTSPVVYGGDERLRAELLALADRVTDRAAVGRHYLHVGRSQRARFLLPDGRIPRKKLFYAVRPALALHWLREHPAAVVPPMHLAGLLAAVPVPDDVRAAVDELVAAKAATRELGLAAIPSPLAAYLEAQLATEPWLDARPDAATVARARRDATDVFRRTVRTHAPPD